MRRLRYSACWGAVFGVALVFLGGMQTPAAPGCPNCVVLTHPYGCGHPEAVQGGWICP